MIVPSAGQTPALLTKEAPVGNLLEHDVAQVHVHRVMQDGSCAQGSRRTSKRDKPRLLVWRRQFAEARFGQ